MTTLLQKALLLTTATGVLVLTPATARASSHMDAPLITLDDAANTTDVYAFGCLTYTVLTGLPPFLGPSQEEYCLQHLKGTPRLLTASPAVRALVQMCLTKDRASRPSIDTALVLLKRAWGKP